MRIVKVFVRPDDGERFTINEDGRTYSLEAMKRGFPDSLHQQWTAEQLRNAGMEEEK